MILYDINYNNICFNVFVLLVFCFTKSEWNSLCECSVHKSYNQIFILIKELYSHVGSGLDRERKNTLHCSKRCVGHLSPLCIIRLSRYSKITKKNVETTRIGLHKGVKHCSKRSILICMPKGSICKEIMTFNSRNKNIFNYRVNVEYHRALVWDRRLIDVRPFSSFRSRYLVLLNQTQ